MVMRCILCDRPLTVPAVALEGRNGPRMIGPKCARKAGLIKPKPRIRKAADNVSAHSRSADDARCVGTLDWIEAQEGTEPGASAVFSVGVVHG